MLFHFTHTPPPLFKKGSEKIFFAGSGQVCQILVTFGQYNHLVYYEETVYICVAKNYF